MSFKKASKRAFLASKWHFLPFPVKLAQKKVILTPFQRFLLRDLGTPPGNCQKPHFPVGFHIGFLPFFSKSYKKWGFGGGTPLPKQDVTKKCTFFTALRTRHVLCFFVGVRNAMAYRSYFRVKTGQNRPKKGPKSIRNPPIQPKVAVPILVILPLYLIDY